MKTFTTWLFLLISCSSFGFNSPIPASEDGYTIPNTHRVDLDGKVLRSQAPKKLIGEYKDNGITDVILFKNQTRKEVDNEIKELLAMGIKRSRIHHIPFKWKDLSGFGEPCEQIVKALQIMKKVMAKKKRKVMFHCTAGEDRTGILASLFRILDQSWTTEQAWQDEMCERGYSKGNPRKPWKVTGAIQKGLTPLFFEMAKDWSQLTLDDVDLSYCKKSFKFTKTKFRCQKSSLIKKI